MKIELGQIHDAAENQLLTAGWKKSFAMVTLPHPPDDDLVRWRRADDPFGARFTTEQALEQLDEQDKKEAK